MLIRLLMILGVFINMYCHHILADNESLIGKIFYLASAYNGKCFDINGASKENGAKIHLWDCTNSKNQEVTFVASKNPDLLEIVFPYSDKCLDIKGGSRDVGSKLNQWDCTHNDNQRFFLAKRKGAHLIQSENGLCVDVKDWKKERGAALQLSTCTEWGNQQFILYPALNQAEDHKEEQPFLLSFLNLDYKTELETNKNLQSAEILDIKHTKSLVKSIERWKWQFDVIGAGTASKGIGTKVNALLNRLKEIKNPDQIVLIADATDVLVNGSPEEFINQYLRISQFDGRNRIIFSAERPFGVKPLSEFSPGEFITPAGKRNKRAFHHLPGQYFVGEKTKLWTKAMNERKSEEGYEGSGYSYNNYLNAGMFAGRAKDIIKMMEYIKIDEHENDQALYSEYFLRFPDRVKLDYQDDLFSNARQANNLDNLDGCIFKWDKNSQQFIDKEMEHKPTLIQTPGKYWKCYDWLTEQAKY